MKRDLILSVDYRSDGRGLTQAPMAELAEKTSPAVAPDGSSPKFANSGVLGAKTTRVWVREVQRGTRDASQVLAGLGEVLSGARGKHGGSAGRRLAGVHQIRCSGG